MIATLKTLLSKVGGGCWAWTLYSWSASAKVMALGYRRFMGDCRDMRGASRFNILRLQPILCGEDTRTEKILDLQVPASQPENNP
jgi:hypothetical protein